MTKDACSCILASNVLSTASCSSQCARGAATLSGKRKSASEVLWKPMTSRLRSTLPQPKRRPLPSLVDCFSASSAIVRAQPSCRLVALLVSQDPLPCNVARCCEVAWIISPPSHESTARLRDTLRWGKPSTRPPQCTLAHISQMQELGMKRGYW